MLKLGKVKFFCGLGGKQAIFFVRADWDRIVAGSSQRSASIQPYKNIIITSALDREPYNFYHAVTGRGESGWFGYRALGESSFAWFAGMKNQILIGSDTTNLSINKEVEKLNMLEGNGSVTELYDPQVLAAAASAADAAYGAHVMDGEGIRSEELDLALAKSSSEFLKLDLAFAKSS